MNIKYMIIKPVFFVSGLIFLSGCNDSNNNSDNVDVPEEISFEIQSSVIADQGGVFTSLDGNLTINIPANALSEDTDLLVTFADISTSTDNINLAGASYDVSIGDASLTQNITIEMNVNLVPTHPELAEIAIFDNESLQTLSANFYRESTSTVVALTQQVGVLSPVLRTLQSETGDAVVRGREIFLNETFRNEDFFGGVVGLHTTLNNITPAQAVGLGAQVDLARVPQGIVDVLLGDDFAAKQAALNDPAITRALLIAGAVVGVKGFPNEAGDALTSVGITCALCHGVVETNDFEIAGPEDVTTLPIGMLNLDGTPNTQIDVGAILALTPFALNAGQGTIDFLNSFGSGAFDARALPDNPIEDGVLNPTSIPPLWNFVDLDEQGYAYNWDGFFAGENALANRDELVYDLVLHANGAFGTATATVSLAAAFPPSQDLVDALTAAENNAPGNDVVTQDVLDVQSWERSLISPAPGDFDEALAEEGFALFYGSAGCSGCHSTSEFTGPGLFTGITLNAPEGGLAGGIKTPGLRGIANTAPYFNDSSAATLLEVMEVYSGRTTRDLNNDEMLALVEYMKSL